MTGVKSRIFRGWQGLAGLLLLAGVAGLPAAEIFRLPTANRAIYEVGAMDRYFVPTPGRSWESGTFGCVRSEGWRFHEGVDIRPVQRDKKGEAADPILATADGVVAYVNAQSGLSNYGKYIILRHSIERLEIYSLYAHLSQIRSGLTPGRRVAAGETIGIMGRTANTRDPITVDRAHLHFELNLLLNDRFAAWFRAEHPKDTNDHGLWNGQNLVGLDPRLILLQQRRANFSLLDHVRSQTELCRVWVRKSDFSFVRRYQALIRPNPRAAKEGVAGYEMALNYNGLPFQLIPRAASEAGKLGQTALLSVNAAEQRKNPCRRLVEQKDGRWVLDTNGETLLRLLSF
jgi:murein DD-endopeptidase MepM/ murein hydrolase activator NlpD